MLEDRPILQRSLVAAGAFGFVFSAAMAGTAFMLTGGFGFADEDNPTVRSPDQGYQFAFAAAPTEAPRVVEAGWTNPSSFAEGAPLEAWHDTGAREDLEGETDAPMMSIQSAAGPDSYERAARETEDVYAEAERATAQALARYSDYEQQPDEFADDELKDEGAY